ILFKEKEQKFITANNITIDDIRAVFFPKNIFEKYIYLGHIYSINKCDLRYALLICADYEAKPWWCPRWFIRLLFLLATGNSTVKIRNHKLHRLYKKLTKYVYIYSLKFSYTTNSVAGPEYLEDLLKAI